jgi:hypothetical protein
MGVEPNLKEKWIEKIKKLIHENERKKKVAEVFHTLTGESEAPETLGYNYRIKGELWSPEHKACVLYVIESTRESHKDIETDGDLIPKSVANEAFLQVAEEILRETHELKRYTRVVTRCRECNKVIQKEFGILLEGNVAVLIRETYSCECDEDC